MNFNTIKKHIYNLIKKIKAIAEFLPEFIESVPWIKAATFLGLTILGVELLNHELPDAIKINTSDENFKRWFLPIIVSIYFLLVSLFSIEKLKFQTKLRSLEQNFKYNKEGTLFNGGQPNIAFRVTTLNALFNGLAEAFDKKELKDKLREIGGNASLSFANDLGKIYNNDVAKKKEGLIWNDLSLKERLDQWALYDSSTGWGLVRCEVDDSSVTVKITHLDDLFKGGGGLMFGEFLCGYIHTILSKIIHDYNVGKYADFTKSELEAGPSIHNDDTLKCKFKFS